MRQNELATRFHRLELTRVHNGSETQEHHGQLLAARRTKR